MLKVVSGWITINNKITDLSEFVVFILTDSSVDSFFWSNDVSMLNIINLWPRTEVNPKILNTKQRLINSRLHCITWHQKKLTSSTYLVKSIKMN